MNVYDFDETIFHKDSTVEFVKYSFKHFPQTRKYVFTIAGAGILMGLKVLNMTQAKERFYRMFEAIPDIDAALEAFWDENMKDIHKWYLAQHKEDDVVISASPEFIVNVACKRLGITRVIGSMVDKKTGKYTGVNCHDEEKVRRFKESPWYGEIEEFYSDSRSDTPLALLAKQSYLVKGEERVPW